MLRDKGRHRKRRLAAHRKKPRQGLPKNKRPAKLRLVRLKRPPAEPLNKRPQGEHSKRPPDWRLFAKPRPLVLHKRKNPVAEPRKI